MKLFKVISHQKTYSEDSLLIHSKDHPTLNVGDVVEILSPDNEFRFILQVSFSPKDQPHKDNTISIEHSIAATFQLKPYAEVFVNAVNPKDFSLDSLEISFKDQYLARSDMWRFKKCLVNSCVYPNKKLEFYGTRCQVFEMYAQGEKVTCGIVTEDTKIVYRSCSSMVYIFIQMSCEMWHFDINGDLYFEKAINGFLPDLFSKWKKLNCNHDVTIVLFSRTFYDAQSSDEFPLYMRECLQKDYKGRFFEDFYRVAVQNERYDDWGSTIILLKKQFNQYQKAVLEYHQRPGVTIPSAVISTSSQGNFLEVLNMSLNVFEKHYMDRSFDRTGQLSVVISPGVGVFEVDRELTLITKQRIINNGIGSDLVCLGEQPLHAVPLFKFYNKCSSHVPALVDDYNMPHWINLSFYSSTEHTGYPNFVPRVKIPTLLPENYKGKVQNSQYSRSRHASQPEASFPDVFDYDEYDSQIFRMPAHAIGTRHTCSLQRPGRRKDGHLNNCLTPGSTHHKIKEDLASKFISSDPLPISTVTHACSAAIAIPKHRATKNRSVSSCQHSEEFVKAHYGQGSKDDMELDFTPPVRGVIGSAGSPYEPLFNRQLIFRRPKPLVNPFDPSHITIKLTSNRRRWTHVFPLGPTGIFMQQHHYQAIPQISTSNLASVDLEGTAFNLDSFHLSSLDLLHCRNFSANVDEECDDPKFTVSKKGINSSASSASLIGIDGRPPSAGARMLSSAQSTGPHNDPAFTWLWGATGEQEWTPALTTGVDWKSLVIPACLPITTDYFPDERSLENYYVLSDYILSPEDIIAENAPSRYYRKEEDSKSRPLTTIEVYNELICQRLQQGFQIILLAKQNQTYPTLIQVSSSPQFAPPPVLRGRQSADQMEECLMSIGKIFHQLTLNGSEIKVTQYRPRFPYREIKIHYCYRFHAPDSDTYGVSWVDFTSEKLENYSWNYLDHSICMKGDGEYKLKDSLKFWRLRLLLLPGPHVATRQILEGSEHCDLYSEFSSETKMQQKEGFLKFVELLNKIRRLTVKKPRTLLAQQPRRSSLGQAMLLQSSSSSLASSFRDRVSSNRIHDRPRLRSHSAKMGVRTDPPPPPPPAAAVGRISPATEADGRLSGSNHSLEGQAEGDASDDSISCEMKLLTENSTDMEILEAMKHPQDGLNFVMKAGLPSCTFISGEAVSWVMEHVEGFNAEHQSINLLQNMVIKGIICHASGIKKHPFIHGFYLYCIVSHDEKSANKVCDNDEECLHLFQREYLEVELSPSLPMSPLSLTYVFPEDAGCWDAAHESEPFLQFRCTNLEIDQGTKSGRQEWGQARYQSAFEPYEAFEIVIEWMVATGNIAADLVQGWARKSTSHGLQLVPIPSDPFALPFTDDSDPLRGPIFIALDLSCLMDTVVQSMDEGGLLMLQEKILCKFGFIPYQNPGISNPPQYVHISGSMFVMIPIRQKERKRNFSRSPSAMDLQQISSPHDEYITRHFSGIRKEDLCAMKLESDTKIGFLWSWNYMITKRWKIAGTVDENFMRKVMRDFRAFCANQDSRLEEFYKCTLLSHFHEDCSMLMSLET